MSIPLSNITKKFLIDLEYNVMRSFNSSIEPLQILDRSSQANVFEIIGDAQEIFYEPKPNPKIQTGITVDIEGTSTVEMSIDLTVDFLKDFLNNSILGKAKITAVFAKTNTLTSKFSNCSSDVVSPIRTWRFLQESSKGGINESSYVTKRILDNTSLFNPAYIVTETLKAKDITLVAKDVNGVIITPNIEILKALSIEGKFDYKVTENGEVTIKNIIPSVFAFKACLLAINNQTILAAPPKPLPSSDNVAVADFPVGYAFAQPSSLHNPEILTPVLLSSSGMSLRVESTR